MALQTLDLAVAGSKAAAVTETATVGVAAAGADRVVATRAGLALAVFFEAFLGVFLAGFFLTAAAGAMARALPDRFHASDAAESGQSKIVSCIRCIFRLRSEPTCGAFARNRSYKGGPCFDGEAGGTVRGYGSIRPVTAPRLSWMRRKRSIRTSCSRLSRHDSSRRSRSSAAMITLSWTARPFAVSEIEWLRPSFGSILIATSPGFRNAASVRLTGPLS